MTVTETEMGILIEKTNTTFKRFDHGNKSSRMSEGGGLGMAICKSVVEAYDGTIDVSTKMGKRVF